METSEDRGIECQGVCFSFTEGKIVLAVYQNLPGVRRDLAGTTFLRAFTVDDWYEINKYLRKTFDNVEEVLGDVEEEEEEEEKVVVTASASSLPSIMPGKTVPLPKMTGSKEEEGKDGKE